MALRRIRSVRSWQRCSHRKKQQIRSEAVRLRITPIRLRDRLITSLRSRAATSRQGRPVTSLRSRTAIRRQDRLVTSLRSREATRQRGRTITSLRSRAATRLQDRPVISLADFNIGVKDGLQITGAARPLMFTCDALVLQYYELGDKRATFGHELTFQQWQEIAAVKDLGIHAYRHLPTLSRARSRSLLSIMQEELNLQRRKFTFLCGHDSNVASVMCALEVKDTPLPDTIEQETPIGCKLVVEEWQDKDGESYVSLKLVYPTSQQLATAAPLTADNPPGMIPLHLQNIHANEDGLITLQDFQQRLTDAITSDAELAGQRY